MLLTITTTHAPATDLGFLLHKHPARVQRTAVSVGTAHVLYPEATEQRCTAALLLEVDPIALVRGRGGKGSAGPDAARLGQYVNDRPYAASSMLAVALGRVFSSARRGVSAERPELAQTPVPLEIGLPALSCRGGAAMVERFFGPLGWQVEAVPVPLDESVPEWGDSRYLRVRLTGTVRVADALNHLYVALPVLDDGKHYWVSTEEVDKLLRAGAGWLADHPDRELITRRYLAHQGSLARQAIARLAEVDDTDPDALDDATEPARTAAAPPADEPADVPVPLALQRHGAVLAALRSVSARRVVDLGCGSGALLPALLADPAFTEVVGVDVSARALEEAARRLRLDRMPERRRDRLTLLQGSLTYTDRRLSGYDAAVLMEVVEHLELDRLPALEHAVFAAARPGSVIVTTPNVEHNVRYPDLPAGAVRHRDHRFEWTRAQFAAWAHRVATAHGYAVRFLPVGVDDPEVGPPTQMAVFTRAAASGTAQDAGSEDAA